MANFVRSDGAQLVGLGWLFVLAVGVSSPLGLSAEAGGSLVLAAFFGLLAVTGGGAIIGFVRNNRHLYTILGVQFVTLAGLGLLAVGTTRALFEHAP